jgi:hypothetical protein
MRDTPARNEPAHQRLHQRTLHDPGVTKFGAMIGAGARIGANAALDTPR